MNYNTLIFEVEDNICTITINRPEKLNALNKDVIEDLSNALDEVYDNVDIKSAIITGSGEKAFVAGADITEFLSLDAKAGAELARKGQEKVFNKIENCPKPIVAAVNGFALGGGCELAMACHFRIAGEQAKFGQPEVNLGLIPGYGGTQRLVQLIGKGNALQLLLTGNIIDAATAKSLGLVNDVTAAGDLITTTKKILSTINTKAPIAVAACIAAANACLDESKDGYEVEIEAFGKCFDTADMKEGTTAFLEKRKPVFTGK